MHICSILLTSIFHQHGWDCKYLLRAFSKAYKKNFPMFQMNWHRRKKITKRNCGSWNWVRWKEIGGRGKMDTSKKTIKGKGKKTINSLSSSDNDEEPLIGCKGSHPTTSFPCPLVITWVWAIDNLLLFPFKGLHVSIHLASSLPSFVVPQVQLPQFLSLLFFFLHAKPIHLKRWKFFYKL